MKTPRILICLSLLLIGVSLSAMAIEEAAYTVVRKQGPFEIRDYTGHIVAETLVEGTLENAGDRAFRPLFRYIDGQNQARQNIAMTAPVGQQRVGEKIAMTAPVGQQKTGDQWVVTFMMPATYTMETIPQPSDASVVLREVPPRRMAAIRYKGFWSESGYLRNLAKLEQWMKGQGITPAGDPVWARYNPPFTPWFLRRNEILMPVSSK